MDTHKHEEEEVRRQRRERYIILAVAILIVLLTYIETHISSISSNIPVGSNILVFGLININIILLVLLVYLVLRNFVKLVFERRRRIMGSRLRTKLVTAFVGLSIVPTLLLFFIAIGFITRSIEGWFGVKIDDSLKESLEVAQGYYKDTSSKALYFARQIGVRIEEKGLLTPNRADALRVYLGEKVVENGISTIEVFSSEGEKVGYAIATSVNQNLVPDIDTAIVSNTLKGEERDFIQTAQVGDVVRGVFPIRLKEGGGISGAVVVSYYVPVGLIAKMKEISSAFESYKQLKVLKNPIKASYLMVLLIITLVIVFLATWVGFYLAKGITVPIQGLVEMTHEVASGNLDYRIEGVSSDEIGILVNSFNKMTEDLKASKMRLEEANLNLEQRRRYMEIVLRNVTAGVISIEKTGRITTINRAAEEILGINPGKVLGRYYKEVLRPKDEEMLREMIREMDEIGVETIERQARIDLKERPITILINLTRLKDEDGNYLGMVVVLDDLTQLLKTQRMMAWREVAQRIAHEIKNPLTPIQLSTQRLRKKYAHRFQGFLGDGEVFNECTNTIIRQVEELKTLVNEFSSFARMPTANPTPNDLNEVVREAVSLYQGHRDIEFRCVLDDGMPICEVDRDQMKRALINLLDNSIQAIDGRGMVTVETHYDRLLRIARLEVIDTGCGIPPEDKAKLFEPYFSTKKAGTGLGLAIVNNIIADHNGFIRVRDNLPRGTRFIIELPIKGMIV